ncbi:MAG: DNA cytosine methyltransferase [Bacteroides sp.]
MVKLLIGGSPCTHWSIARSAGREVSAEGIGWELFRNYLYAKEKFAPDFFLYENNKSASPAIKCQIATELETPLQYINSALVSGQNRQRFYCHNFGDVPQPLDRGILLCDILETSNEGNGKTYSLLADSRKPFKPVCVAQRGRQYNNDSRYVQSFEVRLDGKTNTLTTVAKDNLVAEPVRIGTIVNSACNPNFDSKQYRVYSPFGKSTTLCGQGGGLGAKTGLYACPTNKLDTKSHIYEVRNGCTSQEGIISKINLPDGQYIIRKLTVTEVARLQTMPDDYCRAVSDSQAYKGLGNGWTAEIIIHLLSHALRNLPKDEKIIVFSMYDGIGTGRYCLDKLGFTNIDYFAFEIDKYAIKIAQSNYPDIIQCGDAFQVRNSDWKAPPIR